MTPPVDDPGPGEFTGQLTGTPQPTPTSTKQPVDPTTDLESIEQYEQEKQQIVSPEPTVQVTPITTIVPVCESETGQTAEVTGQVFETEDPGGLYTPTQAPESVDGGTSQTGKIDNQPVGAPVD